MDQNQLSVGVFDRLAILYQEKYMDQQKYAKALEAFTKLIAKPDANILDIGCGPGNVIQFLTTINKTYRFTGIDFSPNMIELAKQNNPSAEFLVLDCRKITSIKKYYNGIILGFCTPYLNKSEVEKLIEDTASMLKQNGIFYLSTLEGEYEDSGYEFSSNGQEKCFIYYYNREHLVSSLQHHNFEVIFSDRISGVFGKSKSELIIIAVKKEL